MSNETSDVIANYLKEVGLSDDQANFADGEIFNSLLGLQTLDASINNIIQLTGKRIEELSNLKSKLQENIFSKYKELGVVQKVEEKVVVESEVQQIPIRKPEEKPVIINKQVENMPPPNLPMVEPNEVVHDVKPQETQNKVEIKIQEEPPVKDKPDPRNENYQAGKDPYLEPLK